MFEDLGLILINQASASDSIGELAENTTLPILQDTSEEATFTRFGADKWYIYLLDRDHRLHLLHYSLDLDDDRERLLTEINETMSNRFTPPPSAHCERQR